MKSYPITLHPGKGVTTTQVCTPRVITLSEGANLFEGLRQQGVYVYNACGGQAKCGKCKVKLTKDTHSVGASIPSPTPEETGYFTPQEIAQGLRLACCLTVQGPMELEILTPEALAINQHTESHLPTLWPTLWVSSISRQPTVEKLLVTHTVGSIPSPSLQDDPSYLEQIERATGSTFHPWYLKNLTYIPQRVKNLSAKVTAILIDHQLTLLEAGDTTAACYAMAVDIGTSTIDASLVDLNQGREVAALTALNPQWGYGIDVLSRISGCQDSPPKVRKLQLLVVQQINSLLKQLADSLDISQKSIYQLAIAGNTTMLHLFAGVDPRSIGQTPYVPIFSKELRLTPADCGIKISPGGEVFLLPSVSAYIGADIVAGMLSVRLAEATQPTIFIDLGTNGEVALATNHELLATSCAAGPALEGMNISCGMPALPGAIERVVFNQEIEFQTIGSLPPQGLCGSGVIDVASELIRCGIVDKRGKFKNREALARAERPWLAEHITEIKGEPTFLLYKNEQCQIYFSQTDFRQIQLARGAICSAIEVLLTEANLKAADIRRFIIAGRFGKSIRPESFQHLGIIPAGFTGQLDYAGNSAKTGAMMALINSAYRQEAEKLRQQVNTIDLSTYPGYERILMKHLVF